jgi:hypothetical protein
MCAKGKSYVERYLIRLIPVAGGSAPPPRRSHSRPGRYRPTQAEVARRAGGRATTWPERAVTLMLESGWALLSVARAGGQ